MHNLQFFNLLFSITLLSVIALFFFYGRRVFHVIQSENQVLKAEKEHIQSLYDDMKIFKHDYVNTMSSIGAYISQNDITGLRHFYSNIYSEINDVKVLQSINTSSINEPSIYGIIYSKYKEAKLNNINFEFHSMIDYKKLNIDVFSFSKMLGILLDNAIYNAKLSKEKKIYLSLETEKDNKQTLILKNSYANKDVDINKIFDKHYSTKATKSGLGLWEVKHIIDNNYNAEISTSKNNEFFTQKIVMESIN